jgi:hypothetical protein
MTWWTNSWDNWGQEDWNQGSWRDEKWKGTGKKANWKKAGGKDVTTLGLKHPMPLEDRRDLVLGLVNKLRDDVGTEGGSFKLAVSAWGPVLLHAVLFYLARARPCMKVAALRNENDRSSTQICVGC